MCNENKITKCKNTTCTSVTDLPEAFIFQATGVLNRCLLELENHMHYRTSVYLANAASDTQHDMCVDE